MSSVRSGTAAIRKPREPALSGPWGFMIYRIGALDEIAALKQAI